MKISLDRVGKRYAKHWVFGGISHTFAPGSRTAILGHNGSGKSTLLRIIAGMQPPTVGKVFWQQERNIKGEEIFRHVAFCAPGIELVEELTLEEILRFHFAHKPLLAGFSPKSIIEITGLGVAARKPLADYSSGMKQRVKLALAFFSGTPILLLDEPCTNLDEAGVAQYIQWLTAYSRDRTTIIASNDPREYPSCNMHLVMSAFQQ